MPWLLDVAFNDDLSRNRPGHGARNMAAVRHFAPGLIRANKAKGSVTRQNGAQNRTWDPSFHLEILRQK
jgi:hypothetical protein